MKNLFVFISILVCSHLIGQSEGKMLVESLNWKESQLETSSEFIKFCPSCTKDLAGSLAEKKTVLFSNHSQDTRTAYYYYFNPYKEIEKVVISGWRGMASDYYKYFLNLAKERSYVTKREENNPDKTSFVMPAHNNRYEVTLIRRLSNKGVYYYIKIMLMEMHTF